MQSPCHYLSAALRPVVAMMALLAGLPGTAGAAPGTPVRITVYLVRHAEKASSYRPPRLMSPAERDRQTPLTAAGQKRARVLARLLAPDHIREIVTCGDFRRTRDTPRPLERWLQQHHRRFRLEYCPHATEMACLHAAIRSLRPGTSALIVTHSNLIPPLVEELAGVDVSNYENDYDDLYVLTRMPGDARFHLTRRCYGAHDPGSQCGAAG